MKLAGRHAIRNGGPASAIVSSLTGLPEP